MTDDDIRDTVFDVVAREARLDRASLALDTRMDALGIGSLQMIQILFAIEEAFDVVVPQHGQSLTFATLGDLVDGVSTLVADRP